MKSKNEIWVEEFRRKMEKRRERRDKVALSLLIAGSTTGAGLWMWEAGEVAVLAFYNLLMFLLSLIYL